VWQNLVTEGDFVTNSVTKLSPRIAATVTRTSIYLVERKKWLCRSLGKCVAIRWFFHSRKHAYFILKHSKFTHFILPSKACISPSISSSEDRCLVWLVYLIHEPDRTSNWSFFFNQNTSLHSIVRFRKELTLSRGSFKTMKDWYGNLVLWGYFLFFTFGAEQTRIRAFSLLFLLKVRVNRRWCVSLKLAQHPISIGSGTVNKLRQRSKSIHAGHGFEFLNEGGMYAIHAFQSKSDLIQSSSG